MQIKRVAALAAAATILLTISACAPKEENDTPPGMGPSWEVHALLDKNVELGGHSVQFPSWDTGEFAGSTYIATRNAGEGDAAAMAIYAQREIPVSSEGIELDADMYALPALLQSKLDAAMYWAHGLRYAGGEYMTDDLGLDGFVARAFSGEFSFAGGDDPVKYGGQGYCIRTEGVDFLLMVVDMSSNQAQGTDLTLTIEGMAESFGAATPAEKTTGAQATDFKHTHN